ncbi:MAG: hypothetical protein JXB32_25185 [Deltaproteobacteria bacterium]|nr:hypothetical protein [Deltaproteobacteria bacterium]
MSARRATGRGGAAALAALTLGCGLETSGIGWNDAPWDGAGGDGDAWVEADAGDDGAPPPTDDGATETSPPDADARDDAGPSAWCGDGLLQPGEECEPGDTESCISACGPGVRECSPVCTWDLCRSTAVEACNGVDDDCSGRADDGPGMECVAGMEEPCGPCRLGARVCDRATCVWGECAMTVPDACEPGTTEACPAPICGAGHRTCLPGCVWDDCVPDVNECSPGTTQVCDGPDWCGEGVQFCGDDCRWGRCDGSPAWDCDSAWDTQTCERYPGCYGYRSCDYGCHWSSECKRIYC